MTVRLCVKCGGPTGRHRVARGLCEPCRQWATYHGLLDEYPRVNHTRADLLEDVAAMAASGETREGAARRLGIKPRSVEQALRRAGRTDLWEALT